MQRPTYLTLLLLTLSHLSSCATPTLGPTAPVSIYSAEPFATMKPCAQGCLVYNGDFGCNNRGYYDLGIELACGCSPQNFCYCDPKAGASATAYISSCVNDACGEGFPGEVTSAFSLYDGYCATANVALSNTVTKPTPTGAGGSASSAGSSSAAASKPTPTGAGTGATGSAATGSAASNPTAANPDAAGTGAAGTGQTVDNSNSGADKKRVLGQVGVVALGLGVGYLVLG